MEKRVDTHPTVKSIAELSQEDLDASTSLFVIRVNDKNYASDSVDMNISGTDRPIKIAIYPHRNYGKGFRDLATIINTEASGMCDYGCIYYVLNATNADEARASIETYANKMGVTNGYGKLMPNFCAQMNLGELSRKHSSSGGPGLPRNVTLSDTETAERLRKREMGMGGRNKSGKRRTRGGRRRKGRRPASSKRTHRKRT